MQPTHDVIIIGGGAAGLSAALVLGAARRSVALVDAGAPRNAAAAHLHGFLSRDGADPAELLAVGRDEVRRYGVDLVEDTVTAALPKDGAFAVELAHGDPLVAPRIVLAVGTTDSLPNLPGLREGWGDDVLHCPYCHGHEVADRRIVILATHPGSAHQAHMVRQWSDDVTLLTNEVAELDADARAALERRGIRVVDGAVAQVDRADGALTGVRLTDGTRVPADALFLVPRMEPPSFLVERLDLATEDTPMGPAVRTHDNGRTNVAGVWAAGNCADPSAQVVTAASDGTLAGMDVNADMVDEDCAA
ncbi:NAD(P)/FAD-dependent oxidoreductase [Aeromicrobium chenweiae]|uniref:Thioredoxin reductase n=1 Tax=Aeromicrobium chenweiae TaxID=2079793 RepID=A0A2S0WNN1_9ACTN|nr:NAD(P)/FAD-dependent oxidoreductase [Aeromicrobium chenweiae]AWB92880.1 thioredoxin reductase [Aeromicrobium chenweiae]TGN33875.1 NAD(P)/FAD-dependent oxidoreductase [Aeromicrobium chenweiae]